MSDLPILTRGRCVRRYDADFEVLHTEPTMNVALIMNIADIDTRKAVVHAVNKGPIVDSELGGIEEPASQLFSENAPYCDIDLTPKFDYDIEKAYMLNCPDSTPCGSTLDFILLDGNAAHAAIEDDIRADLAAVGITAVARPLAKDDLNAAMVAGDFDLVFSETWGAPCECPRRRARSPTCVCRGRKRRHVRACRRDILPSRVCALQRRRPAQLRLVVDDAG